MTESPKPETRQCAYCSNAATYGRMCSGCRDLDPHSRRRVDPAYREDSPGEGDLDDPRR